MLNNFTEFLLRDLNKLKEEISLYKNENDIWILKGDVKNSAGTLALHLIGNLKHFQTGMFLKKNCLLKLMKLLQFLKKSSQR